MKKENRWILSNATRNLAFFFLTLMFITLILWLYSDLRYYDKTDSAFSVWQIPLAIFVVGLIILVFIYNLFKNKHFNLFILTFVMFLISFVLPYEKVGDFQRLRDLSFCESDGRLCRIGLYPYLTNEWCIQNNYKISDDGFYCRMRIN